MRLFGEHDCVETCTILRFHTSSVIDYHSAIEVFYRTHELLFFMEGFFLVCCVELEDDLRHVVLIHDYSQDLLLSLKQVYRRSPLRMVRVDQSVRN